eukprot:254045-Amphidinium_carterae.1
MAPPGIVGLAGSTTTATEQSALLADVHAGEPPTKSGANAQNNQNSLLTVTEQTLRKQIRAAKDDPVLTEILEAALTKLTTDKEQALVLKDQRAKLMAAAKELAEKVDMQTKVIEEAVERRAAGNSCMATTHYLTVIHTTTSSLRECKQHLHEEQQR